MNRRRFLEKAGYLAAAAVTGAVESREDGPPLCAPDVAANADQPIALHPENPRYFLFRGKPLVLIAASEHYGSVVNRRFNFHKYLEEAADKKQTMTRTFLLYRELQAARNPYSPVKPESPDFISPWPRTGPGKAMDGELIYDLSQWNPEYFDRLHAFLSATSRLGIVVELTVFSNTYADNIWALNPLRAENNKQRIGKASWQEYVSLRDPALLARQEDYARKIIAETSGYDHIYYEICNEPGGGMPGHVTRAEVDAWQRNIAGVLRQELASRNRRHLLFGQGASTYSPHFQQSFDESLSDSMLDAVNIHPLPNLTYHDWTYQLGNFMSKELQLDEFRKFFLAISSAPKPCVSDEDNCASMYRDDAGWTIHRKRAWMAVMCGAHYDYIDFSIMAGSEAGSEESRKNIRSWMKNLSEFIQTFDFIHARPAPNWIDSKPGPVVVGALAVPGSDYVAYLADGRELTDPLAGEPVSGAVSVTLPHGRFRASYYSPEAGMYSPVLFVEGGQRVTINLPPFQHDMVLRVQREGMN